MALSPVGTNYYGDAPNRVTFPADTETVGFDLQPQYDAAGRTVTHTVVRVTLKFRVHLTSSDAAGVTTDSQVQAIYQTLTAPAQSFVYTSKGFGDIQVNAAGSAKTDVMWGPKPEVLKFKHLAAERAVEIVWTVLLATVLCYDAVFSGQPMELCFRLGFEIDQSGYTKRAYSGFIRIPQTRSSADARTLTASADDWREQIDPPLLPGFRRVYGPFTLDESKCRLDWSITDEEEGPEYLPPGVVAASVRHVVQNIRGMTNGGFARWAGQFSGTVEMARDRDPAEAAAAFMGIVRKRLAVTQALSGAVTIRTAGDGSFGQGVIQGITGGGPDVTKTFQGGVIPVHFEMSQPDLFGKSITQFSLGYTFASSLQNIMLASAMWLPTDGDWYTWAGSLGNTAFHPRGNAKLKFNAGSDDRLVDLCRAGQLPTLNTNGQSLDSDIGRFMVALVGNCPSADESWILYENRLVAEDDQQVIVSSPLPTVDLRVADVTTDFFGNPTSYTLGVYETQADSTVQRRTGGQYVVRLVGRALRACYSIPPPELKDFAGVPATLANRADYGEGFETWVYGDYGHTVIAARWNLRYVIPRPAQTQLQALGTPLVGASLSTGGMTDPGVGQLRTGVYTPSLTTTP